METNKGIVDEIHVAFLYKLRTKVSILYLSRFPVFLFVKTFENISEGQG